MEVLLKGSSGLAPPFFAGSERALVVVVRFRTRDSMIAQRALYLNYRHLLFGPVESMIYEFLLVWPARCIC